jgi:protein tyrosine phosphatase (PTP) superfamily phosphohydrolase (DUF442 family)
MDGAMPESQNTYVSKDGNSRSLRRIIISGSIFLLIVAVAFQAYYVFLAGNLHAVITDKVYRCGQLSAETLQRVIVDHEIRTVVNLRGGSVTSPWYVEECRATHDLNVAQEDICFSANRLPSVHELRRLVQVLDRAEYPILLHCRHGADRTGLASAIALLLQSDTGLNEARGQLAARFGHFSLGRLRFLDRFLELYSLWLESKEFDHTPNHFREWIATENFPGEGRCTLEALQVPEELACGDPGSMRVRVCNKGITAWQLQAGTNAGFHAGFILFDQQDRALAYGRAGLLDALVAPGQSIDLTVVFPAVRVPGKYRLMVDMVDEPQGWFYQLGSEPLETEITVVSGE